MRFSLTHTLLFDGFKKSLQTAKAYCKTQMIQSLMFDINDTNKYWNYQLKKNKQKTTIATICDAEKRGKQIKMEPDYL